MFHGEYGKKQKNLQTTGTPLLHCLYMFNIDLKIYFLLPFLIFSLLSIL